MAAVYHFRKQEYKAIVDVFITKIRKYLKEDPNLNIENVFGVGFIFNVPAK